MEVLKGLGGLLAFFGLLFALPTVIIVKFVRDMRNPATWDGTFAHDPHYYWPIGLGMIVVMWSGYFDSVRCYKREWKFNARIRRSLRIISGWQKNGHFSEALVGLRDVHNEMQKKPEDVWDCTVKEMDEVLAQRRNQ